MLHLLLSIYLSESHDFMIRACIHYVTFCCQTKRGNLSMGKRQVGDRLFALDFFEKQALHFDHPSRPLSC